MKKKKTGLRLISNEGVDNKQTEPTNPMSSLFDSMFGGMLKEIEKEYKKQLENTVKKTLDVTVSVSVNKEECDVCSLTCLFLSAQEQFCRLFDENIGYFVQPDGKLKYMRHKKCINAEKQ